MSLFYSNPLGRQERVCWCHNSTELFTLWRIFSQQFIAAFSPDILADFTVVFFFRNVDFFSDIKCV